MLIRVAVTSALAVLAFGTCDAQAANCARGQKYRPSLHVCVSARAFEKAMQKFHHEPVRFAKRTQAAEPNASEDFTPPLPPRRAVSSTPSYLPQPQPVDEGPFASDEGNITVVQRQEPRRDVPAWAGGLSRDIFSQRRE